MMTANILSALLLASVWALNDAQPINDICETATEISTYPFKSTGTLANATAESWIFSRCGSVSYYKPAEELRRQEEEETAVWYKIKDVPEGTQLKVACKGVESEVHCHIMRSNTTLGECPSVFYCVDRDRQGGILGLNSGETTSSLSYDWIAKEGEIYYIYLYVPNGPHPPGPSYNLWVDKPTDFFFLGESSNSVGMRSSSSTTRALSLLFAAVVWIKVN